MKSPYTDKTMAISSILQNFVICNIWLQFTADF